MRAALFLLVSNLALYVPWSAAQKADEVVATGEVVSVSDDKKVLQLNKTPCSVVPNNMSFLKPWKMTVGEKQSCPKDKNGKVKTYTEVQVEQLEEEAPPSSATEKSSGQPSTNQPQTKPNAPPSSANPPEKPPEKPPADQQQRKPNGSPSNGA